MASQLTAAALLAACLTLGGPKPPAAQSQTPKPLDAKTPIVRPLPDRTELQRLLREVAREAIELAKEHPAPHSWALATIASTQAKVGDEAGAKLTLDAAVEQSGGPAQGGINLRTISYIGGVQAELGMNEDARSTLRRSVDAIPAVTGDFSKDHWMIILVREIVTQQARAGDRLAAKETLKHLEQFVSDALKKTRIGNADQAILPELAGAQAAAGDFDAAFATVERVRSAGHGLGYQVGHTLGMVASGARYLKPLEVRRFVRRVAEEMSQIKDPAKRQSGDIELADAQARLGDFEAARKSALNVGEGVSSIQGDMTINQPYALLVVAMRQKEAGDLPDARETLRLAYESVRKHPKMSGRSGRLWQVAEAQAQLGDLDGALRSAVAIERGRKAEALSWIALAQAVAGRAEAARGTFKEALEDAQLAQKHPPRPEIDLGPGANGPSPSLEQNLRLAVVQGAAGHVDEALKTAGSIPDPSWKRRALSDIVQGRARAADLAEALRLARSFELPDERRDALEKVADGLSTRLGLEEDINKADRRNQAAP
jgi:tetratricopeptide (TPR) repeat protein